MRAFTLIALLTGLVAAQAPSTTIRLTSTSTTTKTIYAAKSTVVVTASASTLVSTSTPSSSSVQSSFVTTMASSGAPPQQTNGTNPTPYSAKPTISAAAGALGIPPVNKGAFLGAAIVGAALFV